MKFLSIWAFVAASLLSPLTFAQTPSPTPAAVVAPSPAPSASPVAVVVPPSGAAVVTAVNSAQGAQVLDVSTALSDVILAVQSMGGLSGALKILAGILIFIALCKVSSDGKIPILSSLWPSSQKVQIWVAPLLGLIIGFISMGNSGTITIAGILAYMATGAGAVFVHEILDLIKLIPGIGAAYVTVINVIEGALGPGSTPPPSTPAA